MVSIKKNTPPLLVTSIVTGLLAYFALSPAHANSLSLSLGQYQDTFYLSDTHVDLTPKGATLYGNLDITEQLGLNISYGRYQDDTAVNERTNVDLDSDSWRLGLSYQWQNWYAVITYGDLDEDIMVANARVGTIFTEQYQAPNTSASISYGDFTSDSQNAWYWSLAGKLKYTDWQRASTRIRTREDDRGDINTRVNEIDSSGDSLFASLHISLSRWQPLSGNQSENLARQQSISYGAGISWHHLISGETDTLARNLSGARPSGGSTVRQASFSQQVSGDEYGLVNVFIGYQFSSQLGVELNISTSFAADDNARSGNFTFSYGF
ncbi:hypothetical protein DXX93_03695 [Thalassotalea euphylliae]|uniref:Autotransporter domain-containing protein n=1 Tax=Thalassotalea euphylliae TaxID=1655234 RepID=A0A3E0TP26_9GAMM|nr:hypothetical protein [Thalassotalea euphylliae]REL25745.1 hypothetical protein DXX93_03695 [Thalassotalea euphylliae]